MKYENIKRANEICNEIEGHERMCLHLSENHLKVTIESYRTLHIASIFNEENETLKFLAIQYKNNLAQYYRNRIESLKTELEKL